MPIHVPGKRNRHNKVAGSRRATVVTLSLTAMVDMFTVLVVFLLQNLNMTGAIIEIPDDVKLPMATSIKEMKPSNVVVVSTDKISLNNETVYDLEYVRGQQDWLLEELKKYVQQVIAEGETQKGKLGAKLKKAVDKANSGIQAPEVDEFRKMTLQADKDVDFLTIKKVMYTLTEAGIQEINFAVLRKEKITDEI